VNIQAKKLIYRPSTRGGSDQRKHLRGLGSRDYIGAGERIGKIGKK